ncbi:MAG TPA: reductive dehalogenase domain-containing protein [Phycisphaerae bacterium]|nr:reductive dehalogenase domain-containing protein [Phycisphaerae bacterium]
MAPKDNSEKPTAEDTADACGFVPPNNSHHIEHGGAPADVHRAVGKAARIIERGLIERFFGPRVDAGALSDAEGQRARAAHSDPVANAETIKQAAVRFGADLVGICALDEPNATRDPGMADVPPEYRRAVVLAVAMDARQIARSPAPAASAETSIGYMRMTVCASALAVFVRQYGYRAIAAGNARGFSVPLAARAGLNELGRNAMLVTRQHGPCVRISKVFTDMPLTADKPMGFGVRQFCDECGRCVEACPPGAIDADWVPLDSPGGPSHTSPAPLWVDGKKCVSFWKTNGTSCATCIAVCPYTK